MPESFCKSDRWHYEIKLMGTCTQPGVGVQTQNSSILLLFPFYQQVYLDFSKMRNCLVYLLRFGVCIQRLPQVSPSLLRAFIFCAVSFWCWLRYQMLIKKFKVPQLTPSLCLFWPNLYEEFEPKQTLKIHQIICPLTKILQNDHISL